MHRSPISFVLLLLTLWAGTACIKPTPLLAQVPEYPPDMSLSIDGLEGWVSRCDTRTITITLVQMDVGADNPRDTRLALSGLNYYVLNPAATVCGGDVSPISCTPTIAGNDYLWYFSDAFSGAGQTATLQMDVQKRCGGDGDMVATAYFDDNAHDDEFYDDTYSVTAVTSPEMLSANLTIEKEPGIYYATTDTAVWKIFITNSGDGTAHNVWIDDILGADLDYDHGVSPAVVDDMTGVTITSDQDHNGGAINGCGITVSSMAPGEQREITLTAVLIGRTNLTNDAAASFGCVAIDCQTPVSDNSSVDMDWIFGDGFETLLAQ